MDDAEIKFIMLDWKFKVGLELRSELLPTVWDSSLRIIWRHTITILICHRGDKIYYKNCNFFYILNEVLGELSVKHSIAIGGDKLSPFIIIIIIVLFKSKSRGWNRVENFNTFGPKDFYFPNTKRIRKIF